MTVDRLKALEMHRRSRGKIKIYPTINIRNEEDLAMAYALGSIHAANEIIADKNMAYEYTGKGNRLAIITDGSAVLGMGNIGPDAALPVMEGKCLLLKHFGDVNAFPLCISSQKADDIICAARLIAPTVGAINIEDVVTPRTFTVVRKLQDSLDIPVICDDQHGTSVVVLAALMNSLEVVGKKLEDIKIVIFGSGAAGIATAELLLYAGAKNIVNLNSKGILGPQNPSMNYIQEELSVKINPEGLSGDLGDAIKGADVLIGVSGKGKFSADNIRQMNTRSIVFALSRPEPEINPEEAKAAGATIVACGLSESINAMPNLHAFPGISRGLLDVRAKGVNNNILIKAAEAVASVVDRRRLSENRIVPELFSDEGAPRVAEAVAQAAIEEGLAQIKVPPKKVYDETWNRLYGGHMAKL